MWLQISRSDEHERPTHRTTPDCHRRTGQGPSGCRFQGETRPVSVATDTGTGSSRPRTEMSRCAVSRAGTPGVDAGPTSAPWSSTSITRSPTVILVEGRSTAAGRRPLRREGSGLRPTPQDTAGIYLGAQRLLCPRASRAASTRRRAPAGFRPGWACSQRRTIFHEGSNNRRFEGCNQLAEAAPEDGEQPGLELEQLEPARAVDRENRGIQVLSRWRCSSAS